MLLYVNPSIYTRSGAKRGARISSRSGQHSANGLSGKMMDLRHAIVYHAPFESMSTFNLFSLFSVPLPLRFTFLARYGFRAHGAEVFEVWYLRFRA